LNFTFGKNRIIIYLEVKQRRTKMTVEFNDGILVITHDTIDHLNLSWEEIYTYVEWLAG